MKEGQLKMVLITNKETWYNPDTWVVTIPKDQITNSFALISTPELLIKL